MNTYRILYESGGHSLEISPDAECRLVEDGLHGFDCTGFDVKIQPYAASHGGYAQIRRFAERELAVTFEIAAHGERAEEIRRKIISMTSPQSDGTLDVTLFGIRRTIDVIPADEQDFERAAFSDCVVVTLHFIAPQVFFKDYDGEIVRFRDAAPMLTFPMNLMKNAGTAAGMYRTTDSAKVENNGDTECGIVAKIRADGGAVVYPGLKCGEKFIRCPMTLEDGDELVIDTRARRKNITKNGERCFTFDRDSTFFSLPKGITQLSVTCDSGGEYVSCEIEYVPMYYGM